VILGQTIVALVFAQLASHFPVAGSIYQRSKRLFNRTLGWSPAGSISGRRS